MDWQIKGSANYCNAQLMFTVTEHPQTFKHWLVPVLALLRQRVKSLWFLDCWFLTGRDPSQVLGASWQAFYGLNQLAVAAQALTEHYGRCSDKVKQIRWSLNKSDDGMFVETRYKHQFVLFPHLLPELALLLWVLPHQWTHTWWIYLFNFLDFGWDTIVLLYNNLISAVHYL